MLVEYKGMDITDRYEIKLGNIIFVTVGDIVDQKTEMMQV